MYGYLIYDCFGNCLFDSGLLSYDSDDVEEDAVSTLDEFPTAVRYSLYCIDD